MSHPQGPQDWQGQSGPAYGSSQPSYEGSQPAYGSGGYPGQPYGSGPDPYGPPPRTSGKATTSLVLGVASMVLFCIGFVLGIPAIVVGMRARKEIRLAQGRVGGDGLALGGIITGALGSLLGLGALALVIALYAFGSSVESTFQEQACEAAAQDDNPRNDCT